MILSSLIVEKLHGRYNYKLNFNRDITLLYGLNGCGKTTILNIITAIITGRLYKLFSYKFEKIALEYLDEKKEDVPFVISIVKHEDCLKIKFKHKKENVDKLQIPEERRSRRVSNFNEDVYFDRYYILAEIKKEFNYVYLALNRASYLYENEDSVFYRRRLLSEDIILEPEFIAPEIQYVENLIVRQYMLATAQINKINDEFRNSILKSALDLNIQMDFRKAITTFKNKMMNKSDIIKTQDSYIKVLNSLNLISNEEKKQYENFFKKYLNRINRIINNFNNNNHDNDDFFNLILESNEMKKIDAILDISADSENRKTSAMKSINLFLNTVNEFISSADIKKKISIDVSGHVYFSTENDEQKLSIQYLSSGERQILVFFANLIFGVKPTSSGIFVVDEPELSLHLSWQKVFLKKALEISNNVQFIFATHAPEIIGKYRDKAKKLERSN